MELMKRSPVFLQLTVITLMSVAASYTFQHTETAYQIEGLCFTRYLAYLAAIFLVYICFSCYKKYIALTLSLTLSAIALSPIGLKALELFPLAVPFLAILMGVTVVVVFPNSQGRGFFEFLAVLILPAIIAESRIGGAIGLFALTESIGYYELSAVTVSVVGGYFYLRYAAMANLSRLELLSSGGSKVDVLSASKRCNIITILVVLGASGISVVLMVTAPIVADALRATVISQPLYVLALAAGAGIAITSIFYIFRLSHKETVHARFR